MSAAAEEQPTKASRTPEEWRSITIRQLQGVRKDIIKHCPSHIAVEGLSPGRHHNRARVSQAATGAFGSLMSGTDDSLVHVKVEKGCFEKSHPVHISGKDCGTVTSITWCADNWTSTRNWTAPLTPEDVTLYDFNYYRLLVALGTLYTFFWFWVPL
ncbi:TTLL3D [Symbiodinium natans]|uniref:TTLL3D protein n=1 Tax=Symbiodinium natans TaxID=878477 RepID=A0A812T689_9DINO|nr:TTLL3D [Symbiodinium natans]